MDNLIGGPDLPVVEDGEDGGNLGGGEVGEEEAYHVLLLLSRLQQAGEQERAGRSQHGPVWAQAITGNTKKDYKETITRERGAKSSVAEPGGAEPTTQTYSPTVSSKIFQILQANLIVANNIDKVY